MTAHEDKQFFVKMYTDGLVVVLNRSRVVAVKAVEGRVAACGSTLPGAMNPKFVEDQPQILRLVWRQERAKLALDDKFVLTRTTETEQ